MTYQIIRSNRKTLALEIRGEQILVRVPNRTTDAQAEAFVNRNRDWIEKKMAQIRAKNTAQGANPPLSPAELEALAKQAKAYLPSRVAFFAPKVGVTYGRITVRCQRTKWGSCSSRGNLNFNCLLMLTPPEVIDSVVVHELCHRKQMNHSPKFYAEVRKVMPEYDRYRKWLKENGSALMARVPREPGSTNKSSRSAAGIQKKI